MEHPIDRSKTSLTAPSRLRLAPFTLQREEKSERSRRGVLDAALHLFSRQGFRSTTVREIADRAGVSVGNVYHHFPDKQAIFRALIDEYRELSATTRHPFTRVLAGATLFPDNIEALGFAARDSVRQYRSYLTLVYVDVIEFGGTHVQEFYAELAVRFARHFDESADRAEIDRRLRPEVSPTSALLFATRMYFNYFLMKFLFGVDTPGKDDQQVVAEMADIIRNGICRR